MNKKVLLLLIVILVPLALAEQTVKTIELPIGFVASASANMAYVKQLNISMPDGYESTLGFYIRLKGDFANTATRIWGKINKTGTLYDCTPISIVTPSVVIRNYEVLFDCTSVLQTIGYRGGPLQVGFMADKVATNVWGTMQITYYNNPRGTLSLSGTEYSPNDQATMFVQLKDSYGNAVSNGSCYLDIWYPLNGSGVHPYTIIDAPMIKALGDDGMYYYDMTAPSTLGVYMLSAKCSYIFNWVWIYPPEEQVYSPTASRVTGTWNGATLALNDKGDDVYERCDSTAAILCQSNYTFNMSQYGLITNVTALNLYFAGQGDVAGKTVTFAYWNGTAFVNLPNILTVVATGATATVPGDVDQFVTNSVPASAIINGVVIIRYTGQTGLARLYNNWLSVAALSSTGTIQDVKGSSEMHITNLANASLLLITAGLPQAVWNYTTRNLTYYPAQVDMTNYTLGALYVWNSTTRYLTYQYDTTNYTLVQQVVWNATNRNLTYFPVQVDMTNYTAIYGGVWQYITRNLTYYPPTAVDVASIWSYSNRTLTYYADMTNYTYIFNKLDLIFGDYLGVQMEIKS
jgi:hypothetical protein